MAFEATYGWQNFRTVLKTNIVRNVDAEPSNDC